MNDQQIAPIHPGEHFAEFLSDLGIDLPQAATALRIPERRLDKIIRGECDITEDTALRLGRYFGISASFWRHSGTNTSSSSRRPQSAPRSS